MDIFDQVAGQSQPAPQGDIFDQVHAATQPQESPQQEMQRQLAALHGLDPYAAQLNRPIPQPSQPVPSVQPATGVAAVGHALVGQPLESIARLTGNPEVANLIAQQTPQPTTWYGKAALAAGQGVGMLGQAVAAGPAIFPAVMGAQGAATGIGEVQRAQAAGQQVSPQDAAKEIGGNALLSYLFGRLAPGQKVTQAALDDLLPTLKNQVANIAQRVAASTGIAIGEGEIFNAASNKLAQQTVDPNRPTFQGAGQTALQSGMLGPLGAIPERTPGNGYVRGWADIPLSERGQQEANNLAQHVAAKGGMDALVTSGLERTNHTAQVISAQTGTPIAGASLAFRSRNWGDLTGQPVDDVQPQLDALHQNPDQPAPNGESHNQYAARVMGGIQQALIEQSQNPNSKAGIVTHSGPLNLIEAAIKQGTFPNPPSDPMAITAEGSGNETASIHRLWIEGSKGNIAKISPDAPGQFEPGLYLLRHGDTPWNPGANYPEGKGPAAPPAEPTPAAEPSVTRAETPAERPGAAPDKFASAKELSQWYGKAFGDEADAPLIETMADHAAKGEGYKLSEIPIDKVYADAAESPERVAKYAAMPKESQPPIIADAEGNVFDGITRVNAAKARGDTTIKAYVPESSELAKPPSLRQSLGGSFDKADASLPPEAQEAITGFVGHPPMGRENEGLLPPLMHEQALEDAYSASPSDQGKQIRKQLEETSAPLKDQLRKQFGKTIPVHRFQRDISAGKTRNVLSWTLDPRVADEFAGVTPIRGLSDSTIAKAVDEFSRTGKTTVGPHEYRISENGGTDIYDRDGDHITGIAGGPEALQDWLKEHQAETARTLSENAEKRKGILTRSLPIEDVIWATNRANQLEIIAKNKPSTANLLEQLKAEVAKSGQLAERGKQLEQQLAPPEGQETLPQRLRRIAGEKAQQLTTDEAGSAQALTLDHLKTFADRAVVPEVKDWWTRLGKSWDNVNRFLGTAITEGTGEKSLRGELVASWAQQDLDRIRTEKIVKPYRDILAGKTEGERDAYIHNLEFGLPQDDPKLQGLADYQAHLNAKNEADARAVGIDTSKWDVDGYAGRLAVFPPAKGLSKGGGSIAGREGYLRGRVFDTFGEFKQAVLAAGGKMAYDNPADTMLAKQAEIRKSIEARRIVNEEPSIVDIKPGTRLPDGMARLDDRLMQNKAAPEPIANKLNQMIAPGIGKAIPIYDKIVQAKRQSVAMNFAASAYHIPVETVGNAFLSIGQAIDNVTRGEFGLARENIKRALPWEQAKFGSAIRKQAQDAKFDPSLEPLVEASVQGGQRFNIKSIMKPSMFEQAQQAYKEGDVISATYHAVRGIANSLTVPIMEHFVPNIKAGAMGMAAESEMARTGSTPRALREALQKAGANIDNVLGQVVRENQFQHRIITDIGDGIFAAPKFAEGALRYGGALGRDTVAALKAISKGKVPEITPSMYTVMGYAATHAFLGASLQMAYTTATTGSPIPPTSMKDYFFPRTGRKNNDGTDERLSLPDPLSFLMSEATEGPRKAIANRIAPLWRAIYETATNEDYKNVQVRSGSLMQQIGQGAAHIGKSLIPFSAQGLVERPAGGGDITPESVSQRVLGIRKAGGAITHSDAENRAYELIRGQEGTRTKEQAARSQTENRLAALVRGHSPEAGPQLREAIRSGEIGPLEAEKVQEKASRPTGVLGILQSSGLDPKSLMDVWGEMTPEEKKSSQWFMRRRIAGSQAGGLTSDQRQAFIRQIAEESK